MKQKLLIIALLLLLFVAKGKSETLVLKLKSGNIVTFVLETRPKLMFVGKELVVKSASYEANYSLSDVDRYYFEGSVAGGISSSREESAYVKRTADEIVISNLKEGTPVVVSTASGAVLFSRKAGGDRRVVIGLSGMPDGVYVMKYGNKTSKIVKR